MLITISGIDGCGKTLQVQLLQEWLTKQGRTVVVVKAYDDMAKVVCRHFIDTWTDDTAIMFLFQALHAQQYAVTTQALEQGHVVIADRWDESYLAYHQNFGFLSARDDTRAMLNSLAFGNQVPDAGFIIQVPPEIARRRRASRGKAERFEDRPDGYYDIVQKTYCDIAVERGWPIIDGRKTPEVIHREIVNALESLRLSA